MTLYRTGVQRYSKYKAKYVPDVIGNRFAEVQNVALERAQEGLIMFSAMQDLVRPILDKYGVSAVDRAKYIAFANKVMRLALRHKGEALKVAVQGVKADWIIRFKADPTILDEIINVVAGTTIPY
jgi:hypothetical protein